MKNDRAKPVATGSIPLISPDLLTEIISTAADIALHVSSEGQVISVLVNPHHRSFGRLSHWEGQPVRDLLTMESVTKLDRRLEQLRVAQTGTTLAVEITHRDEDAPEFPVRYSLHRLATDDSILMLGRDLRPIAEIQQKLVTVQMALERDYEAQREIDTRYRVLLEMTRDAVLLVSMATGRIADLNPAAALLMGASRAELLGASVAQEFVGRRRGELLETMGNLASVDDAAPVDVQARRSDRQLTLTPVVFRAAGERLLFCRLDPPETAAPVVDELSGSLMRLFQEGVDGMVFADGEGVIRGANEAFLNLTNAPSQNTVRGRSMADFLVRGAVDLKVLLDSARRAGHMRLFATRLQTVYSAQVAVEISATWLEDRVNPVIALVIRDASRAEALRKPAPTRAGDVPGSVVELVGASKLKDIVAETADVVERMCIEAAVQITRNNRVAAAEMLGLSRQSLYVKLRKYGLISKDGDGQGE